MPKSKRNAIVAVLVVVASLYRFVSPFLDETKEMRTEARALRLEILKIQDEGNQYSRAWDKKMDEKERHLVEELPESLNSSHLLEYLLSRFEMMFPGKVVFLQVNRQAASTTEFKVGTGNSAARARSVRYKVKAQMGQAQVIPYMEHLEKYSGLFRAESIDFTAVAGGLLEMELLLEFYLAPEEWSAPAGGKKVAKKKAEPDDLEKTWAPVFMMKPAKEGRKLAAEPTYRKPPTPTQVVGASVVIDESIFEEGDHVQGWQIKSVDSASKTVIFKRGNLTHKVVVK